VNTATFVALGTFAIVYTVLAALGWRRPLLARLAFREARRGGLQTALIIAGLALAGMGITAALVGADSSDASASLRAYRSMGAVDLTVTANGAFFDASIADRLSADPSLSGRIDGVQGGVDLVGSVADLDQRSGEGAVRLVGFDPSRQRPFGAYTFVDGRSTYGEDLGAGAVLITTDLAAALHAHAGERLRITVGPVLVEVIVAGIVRIEGPAAFGLGHAVFAPLNAMPALTSDGTQVNVVRLSAPGDELNGITAARNALPAVRTAIGASGNTALVVNQAKAVEVHQAERSTQWDRANLIGMSLLVVAAAAAVVVHLTLMLAEERRRRLGTLRALGLTRSGLVILSVLEGGIYSMAGAIAGVIPGVILGHFLGQKIVESDAVFAGIDAAGYQLTVRPETVATAIAVSAVLTAVTMCLAAVRTARISISSAIRDLPEPQASGGRGRRRVLAGLLAVGGVAGILSGPGLGRLVGGIAVVIAVTWAMRGLLEDRARFTLAGTLILGWALAALATMPVSSDAAAFTSVFFVGVVVSVFGLALLFAANLSFVDSALMLTSPRLAATLRPPVAYMTRRQEPSGSCSR